MQLDETKGREKMAFWLDVALLAVFALVLVHAIRKGFVASILSVAAWVVSLLLSGFVSAQLAQPIYESFVQDSVRGAIEQKLDATVQVSELADYGGRLLDELPDALKDLAAFTGISLESLFAKLPNKTLRMADAAKALEQTIVAPMALAAIRWGVSILLFALLLFVTRLIARKLSKITKLPVLKQADRLLGAALGLLKGLLVVGVLALLLRAAASLLPESSDFAAAVQESRIVQWLGFLPLKKGL
jgi:uncharacterized membrane protein required for colicin V production